MKTMLMTTEQKRVHDSVENAWLGLTAEETKRIINPFDTKNTDDIDNPHIQVLRLLRNPDYFYFTCKHIFNIQILPFQLAILKELWNRKYPMLIASRGAGKCITGDSIVMTDAGFNEIGTLVGYNTEEFVKKSISDKILNENGTFNNIEYGWNNGFSETIKLTTSQGYSIEGTLNHPIRVYRDNSVIWSELKDIKSNDYILIDRKDGWFEKTNDLNPELAYLFGLLVGDGGYTVRGTISFTSNDDELHDIVNKLSTKYLGKGFADVQSSKYSKNLYSTEIWDSLFTKYGFGSFKCAKKQFPKIVLSSSKESVAAFIRGLFDTDGTVSKRRKELEYCAKSTKLIRMLQVILTKFGIISRVKSRYNKLYDRYYNYLYISGNNVNIFQEKIGFGLTRKKELLKEVCLMSSNTNIDIYPDARHNLRNRKFLSIDKAIELGFAKNKDFFFDKIKRIENGHAQTFDVHCLEQDHSFISNGIVSHNSFILALYAMLRAFLHQGCKIIIVGAAFRQSKVIFEYCENIWNNAPILRSMADNGVRSGPKRDIDRCTCIIGESQIIALPIGDGCLSANTQITYDYGFGTISDYHNKQDESERQIKLDRTVWSNKTWKISDESYCNGKKPTKILTTNKGFEIEGTLNHKLKVLDNGVIVWKRFDELKVGDYLPIDRTKRWHNGNAECTKEQAYFLGLMIGDGSWTNQYYLRFATKDKELLPALDIFDKKWSKCSDKVHFNLNSKEIASEWKDFWGFNFTYTKDKYLPSKILRASKENMSACLRGLFDTDGHIQVSQAKGGTSLSVNFTNTSKILTYQIQYILLHYGIISRISFRDRNKKWNRVYELQITGTNARKFVEEIGFGLDRKMRPAVEAINQKVKEFDIGDGVPFDINQYPVSKPRGYGLPEIAKLKKIKKFSFNYVNYLLEAYKEQNKEAFIKLNALNDKNTFYDEIVEIKDSECVTYDMHVPDGHEYSANGFYSHNSKIRGQRANYIIADEFASMSESIYENVISGFAAVRANVVDTVKNFARTKVLKEMNLWTPEHEIENNIKYMGNQAILSGTAYYDFNHFAKYWKRYKQIILSKGDHNKLAEIFGGEVPESFNYRDYCVIRIPVELLPDGFMDEKHVARSKATVHSGIYAMEFSACFSVDSNGFFKRTLIESCVVGENGLIMNSGEKVAFSAKVKGDPNIKYVYGVDPASERDNFSITILEMRGSHRRIVYCWTTTKNSHKEKLKAGVVQEHDFYHYCGRKIRDLMKVFPTDNIIIDSQGGGVAVEEVLQDPKNLLENEKPLWRVIDEEDPKDSDRYEGLHILHFANFASADWVKEANHGLRKDFEDKTLLFPFFDSISLMEAASLDKENNRLYDTLEDCVMEIEELKDELATIVHSQTGIANRDRWDTPEIKLPGGKKGRLRKDRYSALLMANMIARKIEKATPKETTYIHVGGFTNSFKKSNTKNDLYISPSWFKHDFKGVAVKRG